MHGFQAKIEIPCPNNRCTVLRNGVETHSRLLLAVHDPHGRENVEPYYQCERGPRMSLTTIDGERVAISEPECYYRSNPIAVNSSNMDRFVFGSHRKVRTGHKPGENVPEKVAR